MPEHEITGGGATPQAMMNDQYQHDMTQSRSNYVPRLLTERRAVFVYEGARLAARAAGAPIVPDPWPERETAFQEQFLSVIEQQCGPERSTSPEELHDEWVLAYAKMGWTFGLDYSRGQKTHPDMVPYDQLGQLERDKDAVFVALCEIARRWIYEGSTPG